MIPLSPQGKTSYSLEEMSYSNMNMEAPTIVSKPVIRIDPNRAIASCALTHRLVQWMLPLSTIVLLMIEAEHARMQLCSAPLIMAPWGSIGGIGLLFVIHHRPALYFIVVVTVLALGQSVALHIDGGDFGFFSIFSLVLSGGQRPRTAIENLADPAEGRALPGPGARR